MTTDDSDSPRRVDEMWIQAALSADEPSLWSKAELARLFIIPALVVFLFAGGVYWLKLQLAAGSVDRGAPSVIHVRLIPRPDETPIPVDAFSQTTTTSMSRPDLNTDRAETPAKGEVAAKSSDSAALPAESRTPSIPRASSAADAVPNEALARFQQSLLRHISKFQHYPAAAHNKLQGTVGTFFSFDRKGNVLGVWVKTSSGQTILDNAAIETIKRAQPLPTIPSDLPDRLNVQVQLAFDPS